MPHFNQVVLWDDGEVTDSYVYKTVEVKNFAALSILIKETGNKYELKYKIEAQMRVGDANIHTSGWKEIKAETKLVKNTEVIFIPDSVTGYTQLQQIDLESFVWHTLRIGLVNQTVTGNRHADATVIVNKRRAG